MSLKKIKAQRPWSNKMREMVKEIHQARVRHYRLKGLALTPLQARRKVDEIKRRQPHP